MLVLNTKNLFEVEGYEQSNFEDEEKTGADPFETQLDTHPKK